MCVDTMATKRKNDRDEVSIIYLSFIYAGGHVMQ